MYVGERVGDKPNERERERKREEEVRSVRKMETCNIREMRVHPDFEHMELEKHGGIDNFLRERGGGVSQPSSHHPTSRWPRIL